MKLEQTYIDGEFNRFFEFPTDDKRQVSSVSAKFFALHIAQPLLEEIARLQSKPAEQGTVPAGPGHIGGVTDMVKGGSVLVEAIRQGGFSR